MADNVVIPCAKPYRTEMGQKIERKMAHHTEVGILRPQDINSPYHIMVTPIIRGRADSTRSQATELMRDLLAACAKVEAKSLQLTQFAIRCVDSHLQRVMDALHDAREFHGLQRLALLGMSDEQLLKAVNESKTRQVTLKED